MNYKEYNLDTEGIIRRTMMCLGLETEAQLADYIGVSSKTISEWKNKKSPIQLWYFTKIAQDKDISYTFLIDGQEDHTLKMGDKAYLKEAIERLPFLEVKNIFKELGFQYQLA